MKTCLFVLFFGSISLFSVAQRRISNFKSAEEISSYPSFFTEFKGLVYYLATDAQHGRNVWVTDGTTAGTRFFWESEPNRPQLNRFLTWQTSNALYFASNQNIWKLADGQVTKINTEKVDVKNNEFVKIGNKLFVNQTQYLDLDKDAVGGYSLPFVTSVQGFMNQWYSFSATDFMIFQHYLQKNTFLVASAQDNQLKTYTLAVGEYATRAFNFQDKRYVVLADNRVLEITATGLVRVGDFPKKAFYVSPQMQVYTLDFQLSSFEKYVFDGTNFGLKTTQGNNYLNANSFRVLWQADSLIYGLARGFENNGQKILVLNTNNGTLRLNKPDKLFGFNLLKARQSGNRAFLYCTEYTKNYWEREQYVTKIFDAQTGQITDTPYPEMIEYEAKKMTLGSVNTSKTDRKDFELHRIEPTLSLLKNVDDPEKTNLAIIADGDVGYVALNEAQKGRSIHKITPSTNVLTPVYNDPKTFFSLHKRSTPNQGTYVEEDYFIYGYGLSPTYSVVVDYNGGYTNLGYCVINKITNEASVVKSNGYNFSIVGDYFYEFAGDNVVKQSIKNKADSSVMPLPVRVNGWNKFFVNNQLFYLSDSTGRFKNRLFAYSPTKGFSKITDWPVERYFVWKNNLIVVEKSGKVYLIEANDSYRKYELMTVSIDKDQPNSINHQTVGDGFVIYTQRKLWYSDGTCQNSGLIYEGKGDDGFGNFEPLDDGKKFVFLNQQQGFVSNGKFVIKIAFPYSYVGATRNAIYYTDYKDTYPRQPQSVVNLYQFNFQTNKSEIINSVQINGYGWVYANLAPLSNRKFLTFDKFQYVVTSNDQTDVLTLINQSGSYLWPLFDNSKKILFTVNNKLVTYDGVQLDSSLLTRKNWVWLENTQSKDYLYLNEAQANPLSINTFYRVSKADFSIKTISLPHPLQRFKTNADVSAAFPVRMIGTKFYGILESPNEGYQLWEIDEAGPQLPPPNAETPFVPSEKCLASDDQQLIPVAQPEAGAVFPNPTNSDLSIKLPKQSIGADFKAALYDLTGRTILQNVSFYEYPHLPEVYHVNLPSNLATGSYLLKLSDSAANVRVFRFVKQ